MYETLAVCALRACQSCKIRVCVCATSRSASGWGDPNTRDAPPANGPSGPWGASSSSGTPPGSSGAWGASAPPARRTAPSGKVRRASSGRDSHAVARGIWCVTGICLAGALCCQHICTWQVHDADAGALLDACWVEALQSSWGGAPFVDTCFFLQVLAACSLQSPCRARRRLWHGTETATESSRTNLPCSVRVDKTHPASQATAARGSCAAVRSVYNYNVTGLQEEFPDLSGKPGAVAQPQSVAAPAPPDRPGWDMDERSVLPPPGESGNLSSPPNNCCLLHLCRQVCCGQARHATVCTLHRSAEGRAEAQRGTHHQDQHAVLRQDPVVCRHPNHEQTVDCLAFAQLKSCVAGGGSHVD